MKVKVFLLPAMILAGAALAQTPDSAPPPAAPPPVTGTPPAASAGEERIDIHEFRPAAVPMAADPLDLGQPSDPIWVRGDRPAQNRIAALTLRPVEAAVIEGEGANRPLVLSLAVVGPATSLESRADLAGFDGERYFCGLGVPGRFEGRAACLTDSDGDGDFDAGAIGVGETAPDPRQLSFIGRAEPLPAPIRYRPARPDERPAVAVEYRNCARDHDRPRYVFAVERGGPELAIDELLSAGPEAIRSNPELQRRILDMIARRAPGAAECQRAERVRPDEPLHPARLEDGAVAARLGELVIAVGPRDAGAPVRLLGLRNPDRLYRIAGIAVRGLSDGATMRQDQLAVAQRFDRPVLMLAAEPELADGPVGPGDEIARAGIRHGYMGVLTRDTVIRTLLSRRSLSAGTILYGVPMSSRLTMTRNGIPMGPVGREPSGPDSIRLTWCVPVEDEGEWTATCLPQQERNYTILRGQRPAFEVRGMTYDAGTSSNDGEAPVEQRDVAFERPVSYVFRLRSATGGEIVIVQETMFGDAVVNSREHRVMRRAGAPTEIAFADGSLILAERPDGSFEARPGRAFRVGADIANVSAGPGKADEAPATPL